MLSQQANNGLPPGVNLDEDTILTVTELARAIGPRRAGRPTNPETVRAWCLTGIQGVILSSHLDLCVRKVRWGDFLQFRRQVEEVKMRQWRQRQEEKRRRIEAVRRVSPAEERRRAKRTARAIKELEAMGAL